MKTILRSGAPAVAMFSSIWMRAVLLAVLLAVPASPSLAQLVVFDAATTARNSTTAALKEVLYQLQKVQHDRILEMARRLSALTGLAKYRVVGVPAWRTHGPAVYATPYLNALAQGDPGGAAYIRLVARLQQSPRVNQLSPQARRSFGSRLALVDVADAAAIAGIQASGRLRLDGRQAELQVLDTLERDVVDPTSTQSATAVLDKISAAMSVGARQRQARIQLLTAVLEQLLVENKEVRDAEAAALNMQLVKWRARRVADEEFEAGNGEALRTWRQP